MVDELIARRREPRGSAPLQNADMDLMARRRRCCSARPTCCPAAGCSPRLHQRRPAPSSRASSPAASVSPTPPSSCWLLTRGCFRSYAVALIHQVLRGLPRLVNNLAVQALVATFTENKTICRRVRRSQRGRRGPSRMSNRVPSLFDHGTPPEPPERARRGCAAHRPQAAGAARPRRLSRPGGGDRQKTRARNTGRPARDPLPPAGLLRRRHNRRGQRFPAWKATRHPQRLPDRLATSELKMLVGHRRNCWCWPS